MRRRNAYMYFHNIRKNKTKRNQQNAHEMKLGTDSSVSQISVSFFPHARLFWEGQLLSLVV